MQRYLADLVGSVQLTPDGEFTFQAGSARVFVRCLAWAEDETIVQVVCPVLIGCTASPELFEHIATHADDYLFGHLSAPRSRTERWGVAFTHTLLGDYLDPEKLKHAVGGVVWTADKIDDDLKARFGGKRFHDDVAWHVLSPRLSTLLDDARAEAKCAGHPGVTPLHLPAALARRAPQAFEAAFGPGATDSSATSCSDRRLPAPTRKRSRCCNPLDRTTPPP